MSDNPNFYKLTDIKTDVLYIPGRVTLTLCPKGFKVPFCLLVWKIDDPMWKLHTASRDRISDKDTDWSSGVYSFTASSRSWAFGMEANLLSEPYFKSALKLRDRILFLTQDFGINLEYEEFTTDVEMA